MWYLFQLRLPRREVLTSLHGGLQEIDLAGDWNVQSVSLHCRNSVFKKVTGTFLMIQTAIWYLVTNIVNFNGVLQWSKCAIKMCLTSWPAADKVRCNLPPDHHGFYSFKAAFNPSHGRET